MMKNSMPQPVNSKALYLGIELGSTRIKAVPRKWTGRRQDWSIIHAQLAVYFADRMPD